MKTLEITYNKKNYSIRNNMRTKMLFERELKKNPKMGETEATICFAWCAIKGYNVFNESFDEFSMKFDEDGNESILEAIIEIMSPEIEKAEGEDEEKK